MADSKNLHLKIDKILAQQATLHTNIEVVHTELKGVKEMIGEYKTRVNQVENRQWWISGLTSTLGAFFAWLLKK